ncbi:Mur ligase family protein [Patescibacteria group bacterium]
MNKYLYYYQLETYETLRFLKRVYRGFFKKGVVKEENLQWDLKAKFLISFSIFLYIAVSLVLLLFLPIYISTPIVLVFWILRFLILVLSELIFSQYEKRINKKILESAKQKVSAFKEVAFIGIAGSSGKSCIRELLTKLLGEKTVSTSDNDENLVDLAKLINEKLTLGLKSFICEMNANRAGQIQKMCKLTNPKIGILTNINEQHLERYKEIENTINSKFEVFQNMADDGLGVVNLDNTLVRDNLGKAYGGNLIGYTLENNRSGYCKDIFSIPNYALYEYGTKFSMTIYGEEYNFSTVLVGRSNLYNLIAAIVCAIELGEEPESLVERVNKLEHISRNMETKVRNNIHIIDNRGGSNVEGFRNSLEVLEKYGKKKVIVTPGAYEIGEKSNDVHKMLGYMASGVADLIILLGESERTDNIRQGALDNGFSKNKIIRVRDVDEVYRFIDKNLNEGDVVLLENDLDDRFM